MIFATGREVKGCYYCAHANRKEMKCYPKSKDCNSGYTLVEDDFAGRCRCDFYKDKPTDEGRAKIIEELKQKYPDVKFGFHEEIASLQLLHNCYELDSNEEFFNTVCDIVLKYITEEETNIFCVMYDYYSELEENKEQ